MALGDSMRAAQLAKNKENRATITGFSENRLLSRVYWVSWCGNTLHLYQSTGGKHKPFKCDRVPQKRRRVRVRCFVYLGCCPALGLLTDLQYVVHPATLQQSDTP